MRKRFYGLGLTGLAMGVLAVPAALAQEGHPFDGTWRGTMQNDAGESRRVLLIMDYDGEEIGGMINPGPDSLRIESAELDAPNWTLQVSAGPVEFEGTLHEIGARNRFMEGTWRENGEQYEFRVTRE